MMYHLPPHIYWQDASKRQTAGIKFTHGPKIRFFAPQGRLVALILVKLGTADKHLGLLGKLLAKFYLNRCGDWECGPKISKISTFLVKSRLAGANPFHKFIKF